MTVIAYDKYNLGCEFFTLSLFVLTGTYSPDGVGECSQCPEGYTTTDEGATSAEDCTGKC